MRKRDVGRANAARGRVRLCCEQLETRDTPSTTVLEPTSAIRPDAAVTAQMAASATPANYNGGPVSVSPSSSRITTSSTSLVVSSTSLTPGQSVTLTATVTAWGLTTKAGGTVTFMDGGRWIGSATLVNGSAHFTWWNAAQGWHELTAVYGGGGNVRGSTSSPVAVSVNRWSTRLETPWVSNSRPVSGSPISIYAWLDITSGGANVTPGGSITFKDGSTILGTVALNPRGRTDLNWIYLSPGTHSITEVYSGDAHYQWATSASVTVTVAQRQTSLQLATPTFSNAHPTAGTPVTISVSYRLPSGTRATPGGYVTFKDGSTFLGTVALNRWGATQLTVYNLQAGSHQIVAIYSGDSNFTSATSSAWLTVDRPAPGKTSVWLSAPQASNGSPTVGSGVTFGVSFGLDSYSAYTPTGTVTFRDGSTILGTVPLNAHGQTTFTAYSLAAGSHWITAVYSGDAHFNGATSSGTSIWERATGQSSVRVSIAPVGSPLYGDMPIVFQIIVTSAGGIPDGWVSILEGTTVLGRVQLDSHGKAALARGIGLPLGTHTLAAYYDGNARFAAGASTTTFTLTRAPFV
jgi:hypothetical protein